VTKVVVSLRSGVFLILLRQPITPATEYTNPVMPDLIRYPVIAGFWQQFIP
jgi:hypothetical protein